MTVRVEQDPVPALAEYAGIPIAFEVNEVFDVEPAPDGASGFVLSARRVPVPYLKDYDAMNEGPARWAETFDLSTWGFFSVWRAGRRVGCASVARDTPAIDLLEGRRDLALLWDIRVDPAWRRRGLGSALFDGAVTWAREQGCAHLKVETQNVNVAACRFYARHGCVLEAARHDAYPELPNEIQMLWAKGT